MKLGNVNFIIFLYNLLLKLGAACNIPWHYYAQQWQIDQWAASCNQGTCNMRVIANRCRNMGFKFIGNLKYTHNCYGDPGSFSIEPTFLCIPNHCSLQQWNRLPNHDIPNIPYVHTCKLTWQRRRRGRLLEEEDVEEDFEIGYFEEEDYAELEKEVCTLEEMNRFANTEQYVQFRAASQSCDGFSGLECDETQLENLCETAQGVFSWINIEESCEAKADLGTTVMKYPLCQHPTCSLEAYKELNMDRLEEGGCSISSIEYTDTSNEPHTPFEREECASALNAMDGYVERYFRGTSKRCLDGGCSEDDLVILQYLCDELKGDLIFAEEMVECPWHEKMVIRTSEPICKPSECTMDDLGFKTTYGCTSEFAISKDVPHGGGKKAKSEKKGKAMRGGSWEY